MFKNTFSHNLIRKYVVIFGTLFNNIYVNRSFLANTAAFGILAENNYLLKLEDGRSLVLEDFDDSIYTMKVPITYAPKEKMLARLAVDPSLDRPVAISLPRISFEISSISYSGTRKLTTVGRQVRKDTSDSNKVKYVYNPVPYDINFSLYIYVKNAEDGTKIVEQILPYFTPEFTVTAHLIPEMDITLDVPVILNNVSIEDTYEGNYEERRALIWHLEFQLKGYVFGPVRRTGIIKFANTTFYHGISNTPLERVTVQPGLLANGSPTTDPDLSISYLLINEDDDYGFATRIENL